VGSNLVSSEKPEIACMLKAGERERPPRLPNLKLVTKIGHPFSYHLNSEQAS
jgi:hypothetical protein